VRWKSHTLLVCYDAVQFGRRLQVLRLTVRVDTQGPVTGNCYEHTLSFRSILILSSRTFLGIQSDLSTLDFAHTTLCSSLFSPMRATCFPWHEVPRTFPTLPVFPPPPPTESGYPLHVLRHHQSATFDNWNTRVLHSACKPATRSTAAPEKLPYEHGESHFSARRTAPFQ
jgi:hypothetical protein